MVSVNEKLFKVYRGIDLFSLTSKTYSWLMSDFQDLVWDVCDPENSESPIVTRIYFDAPLSDGKHLSDIPGLIDDLKVSLILAVERSVFKGISRIRSCSSMRRHVYALKRVFTEVFDIAEFDWSRWDLLSSEKLSERLLYKPSITLRYVSRIKDYIDSIDLQNLPLRENKNVITPDYERIYNAIGVNLYYARSDPEIRQLWKTVAARFGLLANRDIRLTVEDSARKCPYRSTLSQKSYQGLLASIHLYQSQKSFSPDLFSNAVEATLIFDPQNTLSSSSIKPVDVKRTKNIPVPLFLELIDVSIRFILHYSDALFKAEKELSKQHQLLTDQKGNYLAGKIVNGLARELGVLVGGKCSPFPLAAYKHFQVRNKKVSPVDISQLEGLVDSGLTSSAIMEELNLTEPQFYYRRNRDLINEKYKRNLNHTGISLQKALYQFLPLSCLVVIFAFSARRESEVFGLKQGCYKKYFDGWWINFYVAKSARRHEWFTTVPVVVEAIKILEKLSEKGRRLSGSDSLYRFDDTFNRAPINMDRLNVAMEAFLDFIGVEGVGKGERFRFSEHQFRRFFAIMYFYRYEKQAELEALTYELRHEDWSNTAVYLTEQETGRIFREVEKEYMAEKLVFALKEGVVHQGVIMELGEQVRQSLDVVPVNLERIAMKYIDDKSLRMDFISEGLCFGNTPRRSEKSNCYDDGFVMCHRASEEMCDGCPNLLPIENIKNDRKVAAMQIPECDSSSILEAAINFSNGDRKVEG